MDNAKTRRYNRSIRLWVVANLLPLDRDCYDLRCPEGVTQALVGFRGEESKSESQQRWVVTSNSDCNCQDWPQGETRYMLKSRPYISHPFPYAVVRAGLHRLWLMRVDGVAVDCVDLRSRVALSIVDHMHPAWLCRLSIRKQSRVALSTVDYTHGPWSRWLHVSILVPEQA